MDTLNCPDPPPGSLHATNVARNTAHVSWRRPFGQAIPERLAQAIAGGCEHRAIG